MLGLCSLKEKGLEITEEQPPSRQKEITKTGSPDILLKYMASEQGTMAINWNREKIPTEPPYCYELWSTGTGYSAKLWNLFPWKF